MHQLGNLYIYKCGVAVVVRCGSVCGRFCVLEAGPVEKKGILNTEYSFFLLLFCLYSPYQHNSHYDCLKCYVFCEFGGYLVMVLGYGGCVCVRSIFVFDRCV